MMNRNLVVYLAWVVNGRCTVSHVRIGSDLDLYLALRLVDAKVFGLLGKARYKLFVHKKGSPSKAVLIPLYRKVIGKWITAPEALMLVSSSDPIEQVLVGGDYVYVSEFSGPLVNFPVEEPGLLGRVDFKSWDQE